MTFAEIIVNFKRDYGSYTNHKVALYEFQLFRESFFRRVASRTLDLIVIVVQPCNMGSCKLGNLSSRSTNTTADIKNSHAFLDVDTMCEIMLMSGNGL
jgi:hypothetical protein